MSPLEVLLFCLNELSSDDPLPEKIAAGPTATFHTCRNFRFGWEYFPEDRFGWQPSPLSR